VEYQRGQLVHRYLWILFAALVVPLPLLAKAVVFWQPGFPAIASQPIDRASLDKALEGLEPVFEDQASLAGPETLSNADLLVLPYGSAVPVEAWKRIEHYLDSGGNLLVIGGQPLRVPVSLVNGLYVAAAPQDTYSRALGFRHTYEVPVGKDATFNWRQGYSWLPNLEIRAQRFFAVEGRLNGLGYMADSAGQLVAAPVIVSNHTGGGFRMLGSRIVALDFDPQPGYWQSGDGIALVRQAARYARAGATELSVEMLFSAIRPGEPPVITVHLRIPREQKLAVAISGEVQLQLLSEKGVVATATIPVTGKGMADLDAPFHQPLPAGFYKVSAVYSEGGLAREFYENGFLVTDRSALASGPILGVHGDFLALDGKPFFPVGTNYFTTEDNNWDFSSPRNAWIWDRDFAEMAAHGVSFVRTGVWMPNGKFIEANTGDVNERFLRNLEAFLDCAHRHSIAINFTFFAFSPHSGALPRSQDASVTPPNPYTDPASVEAEQAYVRSVVERFKDVPWLSWDLINEPSFSNPAQIFKGNYPNGDPTELAAWHKWLSQKYPDLSALGDAWRVPAADLDSFDAIPLPSIADLRYERYGDPNQVRALDYNLFAQDMFSAWVKSMVSLIRSTGSNQLIDVGQDEGGVTDRVLNQFYGDAGVSFTTNHTYWQDDALLWDSVAAKRPGMPNITGETGYQPAWAPDGSWRYDEFSGMGLIERKWALGFAAGSSGAMQWDWAREVDFGMLRSDGSAKAWENTMRDLGQFARQAAPFADALVEPDVVLVLPQSYQLSVSNLLAMEAQQTAVRALYNYAHSEAYAVGEYQSQLIGSPKLILLPSPFGLTDEAWQAIEQKVEAGAVLLVTGPFGEDAHFHATGRQDSLGLPYISGPLTARDNLLHFPGGEETVVYAGLKTTVLSRAVLPNGEDWVEKPVGKGRVLFAALPLELNDNLQAVADVYSYALKVANIAPVYSTALKDPGILICPTLFPKATLYVLASESSQSDVSFKDLRSGKKFSGKLPTGRAALLLVGTDGKLIATYHWPNQ
jgi:glycosyl hydrolase family 42 (putative beta-galactosidase)